MASPENAVDNWLCWWKAAMIIAGKDTEMNGKQSEVETAKGDLRAKRAMICQWFVCHNCLNV